MSAILFNSTLFWYAGEVVSYVVHRYHSLTHFLSLASMYGNSGIDRYGVPWAKRLDDHPLRKAMVCKAQDVITIAGLVRCNEHSPCFELIWLDYKYHEKLGHRLVGITKSI